VTYSATGLPKAIPDPGTATSTITVPVSGTIVQAVLQVDITHTYDADVDITLSSPTVAAIDISSDNGAANDNYTNTIFSDNCATSITAGTPPYNGCYKPEAALSAFIGQPANGTWTLQAIDDASILSGTLNSWKLTLCIQ
jgi:subtilisin-like proprotein convertase family protein